MLIDQTIERCMTIVFDEPSDEDFPAIAAAVSHLRRSQTREKPVISSLEFKGAFIGPASLNTANQKMCVVVWRARSEHD